MKRSKLETAEAGATKPLTIRAPKKSGGPIEVYKPEDPAAAAAEAKGTTGLADYDTAMRVVARVGDVKVPASTDSMTPKQRDAELVGQFADAANRMHALAPADGMEGMTAALLVAVQDAALVALRDATHASHYDTRGSSAARADRLLSAFVRLGDFRSRLRGGGGTTQKVTVEHLHISEGGQAVIGAMSTGGGASSVPKDDRPHA